MKIEDLFVACKSKEARICSDLYKKNIHFLYRRWLFEAPLFWPSPLGGWPPFERRFNRKRHPFTFAIAQNPNDGLSTDEWKYRQIVNLVRAEKSPHFRWLLMARWLKQENVCEPDELLPRRAHDELLRQYLKARRVSVQDLAYWALVGTWKPYFERLKKASAKARSVETDPALSLAGDGYHPDAITFTLKKKNVLSAVMHWIAKSRNIPLATLRNAYSRCRR
jgi:hypothetical protein